ncbi:MAG TPA: hypothetical protein VNM47_17600 [Terriglobia bacterium]|nr:hypothetical protein [Terriglobia bacterium]
MKNRSNIEKIGIVALAGLCVFLVFKIVSAFVSTPAGVENAGPKVSAQAPKSAPANNATKKSTASSNSGSALQVQSLDEYRPKAFPDLSRNPFDFGPPPLTPAQRAMQAAQAAGGGAMTASTTAGPAGMPLRAIGYSEKHGVGPEAYLVDTNDVYIVHDGDLVSQRFKILKITSLIVEVQDGASGEKAQLPIPLVQ